MVTGESVNHAYTNRKHTEISVLVRNGLFSRCILEPTFSQEGTVMMALYRLHKAKKEF